MPNGFGGGYGFGRWGGYGFGGGLGFGFHGSSPPWPYVGIGRGGLPRHDYFLSGAAGAPAQWPYYQANYPVNPGFGYGVGSYAPYASPFAPPMTPEQEVDFLRNQAEAISEQLEQIQTRIQDLEEKK